MSDRIMQIRDNVYHIYESLGVFCTLVIGTEKALLIDTGYGFGNIHAAVKEITSLPVMVVNTHGHVDHIQGNKCFDRIYLHAADHALARRQSLFPVKAFIYLLSKKFLEAHERENVKKFFRPNRQNFVSLDDGDVIDIGHNTLEIIHTPGHTQGSVCLLDSRNRILYSGDSFSSHIWLFRRESTDIATYITSIEKIMARAGDFDTILSSHSAAEFKTTLLPKIRHCAENVCIEKSTVYDTHLAGKGLLYMEGFERMTERYGYGTFEDFILHVTDVPIEDIASIEFTSIVYAKNKLRTKANTLRKGGYRFDRYGTA